MKPARALAIRRPSDYGRAVRVTGEGWVTTGERGPSMKPHAWAPS